MEYNWRFWSYCTCGYSESEPELENTKVRNHPGLMQTISFTASSKCNAHVLSSIVLKGIQLKCLEPLHWLMLWWWIRAWKHWGKAQDLNSNRISTCRIFYFKMWWTCSVAMATTRRIDQLPYWCVNVLWIVWSHKCIISNWSSYNGIIGI